MYVEEEYVENVIEKDVGNALGVCSNLKAFRGLILITGVHQTKSNGF